ncbi:MAG: PHP domain-containing protein [Candidatus Hydrogenedentes bacterium]|nr:PHP domain-containing protein [Candidatus Hydrogenedentota bacterium]
MRLKADLHAHAADDFQDRISHSAEMLIDAAAKLNYDVVALACHNRVVHTRRIEEYGRRRNIVVVPALEALIEGKHVVILNPDPEHAAAKTFHQLRAIGRRGAFILAPHPFHLDNRCLGRKLLPNIDCFDGIEYCSLYRPWLNPNNKAQRLARNHGLPMVGTSDCHSFPYSGATFSWIDATERSVPAVIEALRAGRVAVDTRPKPIGATLQALACFVRDKARDIYSNER